MRMIAKGFDMVYYVDQMLMKNIRVHKYAGETWAPLNTTHFIEDSSFPKRGASNEKLYWCFQKENENVYCLGLFTDDQEDQGSADYAYKSEFHNVTGHVSELINGR